MNNIYEEKNVVNVEYHTVSEEEYNNAKESNKWITEGIRRGNSKIGELLDLILEERESVNNYKMNLERNKQIILMYEVQNKGE